MSQAPPTVLYVAQTERPSGRAGGIRAERFVNAMIKHGIHVATTVFDTNGRIENVGRELQICRFADTSNMPDGIRRSNVPRWPFHKPLPGPDADWQYCRAAYPVANWIIKQRAIDLIYVMTPPFCLATVAHQLAQQHRLPLIIELDDAWYTGMAWPYRHGLQRRRARQWERRCLNDADVIVTVTETHKDILAQHFGRAIAKKITTIPHSFDPVLSGQASASKTPLSKPTPISQRSFKLAYVGQVRGNDLIDVPFAKKMWRACHSSARRLLLGASFCEGLQLEWMSPHYLLSALAKLSQQNKAFTQNMQLDFVGEKYPEIDRWAKEMNLTDNVAQHGLLPPEQAQQFIDDADTLVLNLYGIKGLDYHWCVPTKTYTYLGAGKPILALLPPGEAHDIVQRAGAGFFAAPDDISAITQQVSQLYQQHTQGGIKLTLNHDYINQFDLANQERRFTDIVNKVLER